MTVPDHWYMQTILQTPIAGGFTIVITSDIVVHMWLRQSLMAPQKHLKPTTVRGLLMNYDARFCFVVFEDIEQDEPGDTRTHTFTWTGWEYCQTRYFYFWATKAGIPLVSTSPIFQKHSTYVPIEQTLYFYSDKHPEVTSVDGRVDRELIYPVMDDWPGIRDGPGTASFDAWNTFQIDLRCSPYAGIYHWMRRAILLFDTSIIPAGATILEASLSVWCGSVFNNFTVKPAIGVYASWPASKTALIPADYNAFVSVLLSSTIDYDTLAASPGTHTMVFNEWGLGVITKEGITTLGIRDSVRDGPNIEIWESRKYHTLVFSSAETAEPTWRPVLMVKFI